MPISTTEWLILHEDAGLDLLGVMEEAPGAEDKGPCSQSPASWVGCPLEAVACPSMAWRPFQPPSGYRLNGCPLSLFLLLCL